MKRERGDLSTAAAQQQLCRSEGADPFYRHVQARAGAARSGADASNFSSLKASAKLVRRSNPDERAQALRTRPQPN